MPYKISHDRPTLEIIAYKTPFIRSNVPGQLGAISVFLDKAKNASFNKSLINVSLTSSDSDIFWSDWATCAVPQSLSSDGASGSQNIKDNNKAITLAHDFDIDFSDKRTWVSVLVDGNRVGIVTLTRVNPPKTP